MIMLLFHQHNKKGLIFIAGKIVFGTKGSSLSYATDLVVQINPESRINYFLLGCIH